MPHPDPRLKNRSSQSPADSFKKEKIAKGITKKKKESVGEKDKDEVEYSDNSQASQLNMKPFDCPPSRRPSTSLRSTPSKSGHRVRSPRKAGSRQQSPRVISLIAVPFGLLIYDGFLVFPGRVRSTRLKVHRTQSPRDSSVEPDSIAEVSSVSESPAKSKLHHLPARTKLMLTDGPRTDGSIDSAFNEPDSSLSNSSQKSPRNAVQKSPENASRRRCSSDQADRISLILSQRPTPSMSPRSSGTKIPSRSRSADTGSGLSSAERRIPTVHRSQSLERSANLAVTLKSSPRVVLDYSSGESVISQASCRYDRSLSLADETGSKLPHSETSDSGLATMSLVNDNPKSDSSSSSSSLSRSSSSSESSSSLENNRKQTTNDAVDESK